MWFIYILRCADSTLYTGITTDIDRRIAEHAAQGPSCAKYLRGRAPLALVFSAEAGDRSRASRMENRLKQLSRTDKQALIAGRTTLADLGIA